MGVGRRMEWGWNGEVDGDEKADVDATADGMEMEWGCEGGKVSF